MQHGHGRSRSRIALVTVGMLLNACGARTVLYDDELAAPAGTAEPTPSGRAEFEGGPGEAGDAGAPADAAPVPDDAVADAVPGDADDPDAEDADAGDDAGPDDAGADADANACPGACAPGSVACSGDGASVTECSPQANGCPDWVAMEMCAQGASCRAAGAKVACLCEPGFLVREGACVPVGAPRPIAPLSTARATSQQPKFRWALPDGADGAEVEICADRACSRSLATFRASGTEGTSPKALPHGVYFWRLRGTTGGGAGTATSPVWEVFVGWRSSGGGANTSWGSVLDVNGDGLADVALGMPDAPNELGEALHGTITIHLGAPGGPSVAPAIVMKAPDDNGPFPNFGEAVASAGDVDGDGYGDLVVGAPGGNASPGAFYVYRGGPSWATDWRSAKPITVYGTVPHANFGWSVSGAGDVNGDGYADVVAVTQGASSGTLYLGGPNGLGDAITLDAPRTTVAASAGDVNGDGYGDVVFGAHNADGAAGVAFLYLGGAGGMAGPPIVIDAPNAPYGFFAYTAACAGDVNGDGLADIVLGAPGVKPMAFVYPGSKSGGVGTPMALASQGGPTDDLTDPHSVEFGAGVAGAGDVDGDGYDEVLVGTPALSRAYLYRGGPGGLVTTPVTLGADGPQWKGFGLTLGGGGDVDGDGYADVIGTAAYVGYILDQGAAYVFSGGAAGLSATPSVTFQDRSATWAASMGQ
jgi:hypothetical protein